jgi:ParB/RepB/Spo0J family partition protein
MLPVDSIHTDEVTEVRSRKANPAAEAKKVAELATSMESEGQIQPIVVRPDGAADAWKIIAGARRCAAGRVIQTKTGKPYLIKAMIVQKTDAEARKAAIHENLQRENYTAPELARLIADMRERNGWQNAANWSDLVAKELGVSRATVTEHYKLLQLKPELLKKGESGQMSAQSLLLTAGVAETRQDAVIKRAEELAEKEEKKAPKSDAKAKGAEEEKGKVKHKHVLKAAREQDALKDYKPRNRGEIMAFADEILESADPYHPLIQDYFKTFRDKWATGRVGDRGLLNKLDAINEALGESKSKSKKSAPAA